jgi:nitrogen PTS system EIIA component
MDIQSLLTPNRTQCGVDAGSKRAALEILAHTIAQDIPSTNADDLFRRFLARERLGSTGIGYGIAIPHCGIETGNQSSETANAKLSSKTIGALITLKSPVNFDAIDSQPVDILFALLVPEAAHNGRLQHLAALASAMNNSQFRQRLRDAKSNIALYEATVAQ